MNPYLISVAISMAAASLLPGTAGQDLIGIGLSWQKNIFVQEYWQNGKPVYAIANRTDKEQMLTATAWRARKVLAGPWQTAVNSITFVDASGLTGKSLMEFRLQDGTFLGILEAPVRPPAMPEAPVVSFDGLNGSGGRHADVWVEQDDIQFASESTFELRLRIPGNRQELIVNKGALPGLEVASQTLKVKAAKDKFTMDLSAPLTARDAHIVVLRIKAPRVTKPTLIIVDAFLWTHRLKTGHGLTRGIVIQPAGN